MQATTFNVSDKLTLANTDTSEDSISTTYDCNVLVQLAGDSIWDCELEAVTDSWRLYTDSGFADAISTLLGTEVMFTEQGMQDDGYASMEL